MIVAKLQIPRKSFRLHQANHREPQHHQQQQEVQQLQLKLKLLELKQQLLEKKNTKSILMFLELISQNQKGTLFNLTLKSIKIS